jgi:hypothetical protein
MMNATHIRSTLVFLAVAGAVALLALSPSAQSQSTDTPITGWAWSDNVGWVSLHCSTGGPTDANPGVDICDDSDYGLSFDPDTGVVEGYAWAGGFSAPVYEGEESDVPAVNFDGTNDYLRRGGGLTGAADGKRGTLSLWFRPAVDNTTMDLVWGAIANNNGFFIVRKRATTPAANGLVVEAYPPGSGTPNISLATSDQSVLAGNYYNLLVSFDLTDPAKRHLYLNDVSDMDVRYFTDTAIDFTLVDWTIGSRASGSGKVNGDLAEVWFAPGIYIDLSIESNRRKFISATGNPVYLGANGELPTGSSPIVFLSGATDSWHTNKGTGGGFTENGALTDGTSPPPYVTQNLVSLGDSGLGWIKFGGLSGFPTGAGTQAVNAQFDVNRLIGWARACSATENGDCTGGLHPDGGGWDGWIYLGETDQGGGAVANDDGLLSGYAWGSDVIGWAQFLANVTPPCAQMCTDATTLQDPWCRVTTCGLSCVDGQCIEAAPEGCLSTSNSSCQQTGLVRQGSNATLYWEINNVVEGCAITGTNGDSWSDLPSLGNQPTSAIQNQTRYTLTCDGIPVSTATVNITPSYQEI